MNTLGPFHFGKNNLVECSLNHEDNLKLHGDKRNGTFKDILGSLKN